MDVLVYLIPAALFLGALGLVGFLWSLSSSQYEDMEGAAARILLDDDGPLDVPREASGTADTKKGDRNTPAAPDQRVSDASSQPDQTACAGEDDADGAASAPPITSR